MKPEGGHSGSPKKNVEFDVVMVGKVQQLIFEHAKFYISGIHLRTLLDGEFIVIVDGQYRDGQKVRGCGVRGDAEGITIAPLKEMPTLNVYPLFVCRKCCEQPAVYLPRGSEFAEALYESTSDVSYYQLSHGRVYHQKTRSLQYRNAGFVPMALRAAKLFNDHATAWCSSLGVVFPVPIRSRSVRGAILIQKLPGAWRRVIWKRNEYVMKVANYDGSNYYGIVNSEYRLTWRREQTHCEECNLFFFVRRNECAIEVDYCGWKTFRVLVQQPHSGQSKVGPFEMTQSLCDYERWGIPIEEAISYSLPLIKYGNLRCVSDFTRTLLSKNCDERSKNWFSSRPTHVTMVFQSYGPPRLKDLAAEAVRKYTSMSNEHNFRQLASRTLAAITADISPCIVKRIQPMIPTCAPFLKIEPMWYISLPRPMQTYFVEAVGRYPRAYKIMSLVAGRKLMDEGFTLEMHDLARVLENNVNLARDPVRLVLSAWSHGDLPQYWWTLFLLYDFIAVFTDPAFIGYHPLVGAEQLQSYGDAARVLTAIHRCVRASEGELQYGADCKMFADNMRVHYDEGFCAGQDFAQDVVGQAWPFDVSHSLDPELMQMLARVISTVEDFNSGVRGAAATISDTAQTLVKRFGVVSLVIVIAFLDAQGTECPVRIFFRDIGIMSLVWTQATQLFGAIGQGDSDENIDPVTCLGFLAKMLFRCNDISWLTAHANTIRTIMFTQNVFRGLRHDIWSAVEFARGILEKLYLWYTGLPLDADQMLMQDIQNLNEFQEQFLKVVNAATLESMNCVKYHQIRNLVVQAHLIGKKYAECVPRRVMDDFYQPVRMANEMLAQFDVLTQQAALRIQPPCIVFCGRTGQGKSTLIPVLATDILAAISQLPSSPALAFYRHNKNRNNFFDGYMGQPVFWADEWLSSSDEDLAMQDVQMLFDLVNVAPLPLNMAEIENKGKTYFTSQFFLATTNRDVWNWEKLGARNALGAEACRRRISLMLEVELDKAKMEGPVDLSAWKFHLLELRGTSTVRTGQTCSYQQVVERIVSLYHGGVRVRDKINDYVSAKYEGIAVNTPETLAQSLLAGRAGVQAQSWESVSLTRIKNCISSYMNSNHVLRDVALLGGFAATAFVFLRLISNFFRQNKNEQALVQSVVGRERVVRLQSMPQGQNKRLLLNDQLEAKFEAAKMQLEWVKKVIKTNVFSITVDREDGVSRAHCFFLHDRMFVLNRHMINGARTITIFGNSMQATFDCDAITMIHDRNNDIVFVKIERPMNAVKDVSAHTRPFISYLRYYAKVVRAGSTYRGGELRYCGEATRHNNINATYKGQGYAIADFMQIKNFESEPGDCGLPYFAITANSAIFLGIHDAYSMSTNTSFFVPIFSQDFGKLQMDLTFKNFDSRRVDVNSAVFITRKTKLYQTDLYDAIMERRQVITRAPAALRSVAGVDPFEKAVLAFDVPDMRDTKLNAYLMKALDYITTKHQMPKPVEPLSAHDAAWGIGLQESWYTKHASKINLNTSAGYTWRNVNGRGKRKLLNAEGLDYIPEVYRMAELLEQAWRDGRSGNMIAVDAMKDELRPIAKVDACKTRIISVLPVEFTITVRRYTLPFTTWLMSHCTQWESAVGINPHGVDWGLLYERLARHPHWIAGDYSGFDRTIPTQIGDLFADYLLKTNPALSQHQTLIKQMVYDLQHVTHLAGDLLYSPTHGNPSGQPLTACFNSFVNQLVVIGAFFWAGRDRGWTEKHYEQGVQLAVFGDDNLITVSNEVFPYFNFQTIHDFAARLGMKYTDSLKTGVIRKETPFAEVTFLKRQFRVDTPYVFAPLEDAVVEEMPAYAKQSAEDLDMVHVKCYNSLVEKFHYGHDAFDEWKKWLNTQLLAHGHEPIALSYETILNSFVNNMITYDDEDDGGQLRVYQRDLVISEAERRAPFILDDYSVDDSPVTIEFPFESTQVFRRPQNEDTFLNFAMKGEEKSPVGQGAPSHLGTAMNTNNANNLTEQTTDPPSTVENVVTTQDLTAFQEVAVREPDIEQAPPETADTIIEVPYPASDYVTQLERFFQIGEFTWTTEQGINTRLWEGEFPGDLLKHPMFVDRLSYYHYIRGEIEIDVRLTANAFQYGALQLQAITCAPSLTTVDGSLQAGCDRMENVVQGSQNLHVDISAMQNTTVKMIIPWEFPFDYIDLMQIYTQQGGATILTNQGKLHKAGMGEARILVLAPLSTPQKDPVNSVTVTVWARFNNLIVAQPCGTRWIGMRMESQVEGQGQDIQPALARCKLNVGQVVKDIGSGILHVGKTLGNALLKGATGAMERAGGALVNFGVGALLGGSKPHAIFPQKPITLAPHVDLPTISGNNPCNALSLMEDCSVAVDPTLMNTDSGDFAELASIECLQAIATIPVTTKSNTCVIAIPVCPIASEYENSINVGPTVTNRFWTTNVGKSAWQAHVCGSFAAYYANHVASYWRGDTTFRVHFYASQLHQARFTLVWSSTPLLDLTTLPDIYGTVITKQVVLENGEADVEFQVKYSRSQPYLPTISAGYHDLETLVATMTDYEHHVPSVQSMLDTIPYSNGWFYVFLTNAITPFQDGVTAPVRVYVYERWDNFVLQQPRLENPLQDVFAQGQVEGDVGVSVQKKLFQHFGDQMTDVATLLHRPELVHVTLKASAPLPLPLPWEPLVKDVNVTNVQVSPSISHLLSGNGNITNLRALMLPWRFARGSSCYRIIPSARVNQNDPEPQGWLVTLGAASSGNYGPFHPIGAINGASQSFGALWTRNDYYPSLEFTVPWYSHVNFGFIWNRSFLMAALKAQPTNDELWVADHVRAWLSWPYAEPESVQIVPLVMSTGDDFQLGGRTALPAWKTITFRSSAGVGTGFNVAWNGKIEP